MRPLPLCSGMPFLVSARTVMLDDSAVARVAGCRGRVVPGKGREETWFRPTALD